MSHQRNGLNTFKLLNVTNLARNKIKFNTKSLTDIKQNSMLDSPFTIEEISEGIRELKLKKASGNDSIS